MNLPQLQAWISANPYLALAATVLLSLLGFLIARGLLARGLTLLAGRTDNKIDDILVEHLRPFRIAWLVPLLVLYLAASYLPEYQAILETTSLLVMTWIVAITINALLNALNEIYEGSSSFRGVSIQGYLDLVKIGVLIAALIVSYSLLTEQSPAVLLTGLGAMTAVLLLIFRDTILSLLASIQIGTQDLIKEGDWIEVPSYGADGDVLNMSLHTIRVQNFDKTFTIIPTHKVLEVPFKNWRGMQESGGRRIKRSIYLDLASVRFCDKAMIERYRKVDILQPYLDRKVEEIEQENRAAAIVRDSPLDGRNLTNIGTFRVYVEAYLRSHPDIHTEGMSFLVRQLAPGPKGVPLEIYVFTKTTEWVRFEAIQADIFDHLLASVDYFDLRVFQEPTGMDFQALAEGSSKEIGFK